jgi:hypothetical protein
VVGVVVFALVVLWIIVVGGATARNVKRLASLEVNGLRGRALVLSSDIATTSVTVNGQRYERRTMTLDIEIPGRAPYTIAGQFSVPRGLVEPVPGASLDVAVDPRNPNVLVVLGPGGFSGPWIRTGVPAPY